MGLYMQCYRSIQHRQKLVINSRSSQDGNMVIGVLLTLADDHHPRRSKYTIVGRKLPVDVGRLGSAIVLHSIKRF